MELEQKIKEMEIHEVEQLKEKEKQLQEKDQLFRDKVKSYEQIK